MTRIKFYLNAGDGHTRGITGSTRRPVADAHQHSEYTHPRRGRRGQRPRPGQVCAAQGDLRPESSGRAKPGVPLLLAVSLPCSASVLRKEIVYQNDCKYLRPTIFVFTYTDLWGCSRSRRLSPSAAAALHKTSFLGGIRNLGSNFRLQSIEAGARSWHSVFQDTLGRGCRSMPRAVVRSPAHRSHTELLRMACGPRFLEWTLRKAGTCSIRFCRVIRHPIHQENLAQSIESVRHGTCTAFSPKSQV